MRKTGHKPVLFISALPGAENFARMLVGEIAVEMRVARNAKAALATLRREEFSIVLVDSLTIPAATAELIWQRSGLATALEMNLSAMGMERVLREVSGVLHRRERETLNAREEATHALQDEIRQEVTALLLQTELMMREQSLSPTVARKLETLHSLTDALRLRLRSA